MEYKTILQFYLGVKPYIYTIIAKSALEIFKNIFLQKMYESNIIKYNQWEKFLKTKMIYKFETKKFKYARSLLFWRFFCVKFN